MQTKTDKRLLVVFRKLRLFAGHILHPAEARLLPFTVVYPQHSDRHFILGLVLDRRKRDTRAGVSGIVDGANHDNAKC